MWWFVDLLTVPTVCHLLINGFFAYQKCVGSCDLSHVLLHVGTHDTLGACSHCWSREAWSCVLVARAPCFSGSRAGRVTCFTCVTFTFDLELCSSPDLLDVADCIHDSIPSLGSRCTCNVLVCVTCFDVCFSCRLNCSRSSLVLVNSFSGSYEFSDSRYPFHLTRYCVLFLFRVGCAWRMDSIS